MTDLVEKVGLVAVGAVALSANDPAAAAESARSLGGLLRRFIPADAPEDKARKAAQAAALQALNGSGEFSVAQQAQADALLSSAQITLDPAVLADLARGGNPAQAMANRIVADLASGDAGADRLLHLVLQAGFAAALDVPEFLEAVANRVTLQTAADTAQIKAMMAQLLARSNDPGLARYETAILGLARRINADVKDDPDAALRELERAVGIFLDMQARGLLPDNTGAQVDAVLARLNALNQEGKLQEGMALVQAELSRAEAEVDRMVSLALNQAVLLRDVAAVVALERKRLSLTAPPDLFEALRKVRREWYERGRDKGLVFDMLVAIALARDCLSLAQGWQERGAALNDLGNALQEQGAREAAPDRLQEAVKTYHTALLERTRDRVPLDWAMTQNNLGAALQTLGERQSDPVLLRQAVEAYQAALLERTRTRVPLDWAATQNNLGAALSDLGERQSDPALFQQAVEAYQAALLERSRDRVPMNWAGTQNNLGNALLALGQRQPDPALLGQAVEAFQSALFEYTRERVPLDWAATQNNLGNALSALGERQSDPALLGQAVKAYQAALLEYTRERVPMNWATTQFNLGILELALHALSPDPAHLDRADAHVRAAREVFESAGATQYLGMADRQLAKIAARRGDGAQG